MSGLQNSASNRMSVSKRIEAELLKNKERKADEAKMMLDEICKMKISRGLKDLIGDKLTEAEMIGLRNLIA